MMGIWDSPRTRLRPGLDGGEPSSRRTSGTRSRSTSWVSERYRPLYAPSRIPRRIVGTDLGVSVKNLNQLGDDLDVTLLNGRQHDRLEVGVVRPQRDRPMLP